MKPSNILLVGLLSFILFVTVGANLTLKAKYDRIDKSDAFYGYRKESLPAFKYVKLGGKAFGLTQIQPGKEHRLQVIADRKYLSWKVSGDTLYLTYKRDWEKDNIPKEFAFRGTPSFFVMSPELSGVVSDDVVCNISGWSSKAISVNQKGGAIQLLGNKIEDLQINVNADGLLKMNADNAFGKAAVNIKDSSTFHVEKNVFKTIDMKIDSTAHIILPGSLIKNLSPF